MDLPEPDSDNDDAAEQNTTSQKSAVAIKQFRCTICGRGFARRDKLERHNRVHSGEKPFLCFECGRAFARRDKLIRHRKEVHTGERPFRCDLCARSFARRDTLKTHARIHSDRDMSRSGGGGGGAAGDLQHSPWVSLIERQMNSLKRD